MSKGIIPTATETPVTAETPAAPAWKTERLAALKRDLAAAKSGLSDYQIEMLEGWYAGFFGECPEDVASDALARLFLDGGPVQWPRAWRQPYTINVTVPVSVRLEDGSSRVFHEPETREIEPKTEAEINEVLDRKFGERTTGVTARVNRDSWRHGGTLFLRNELVFLPELTYSDPIVIQWFHVGDLERVAEGRRYKGSMALGVCPMPYASWVDEPIYKSPPPDPTGRVIQMEVGRTERRRLPRTVASLIPAMNPETHEVRFERVTKTDAYGEYYDYDYVWRPRRDLAAVGA